jgi:hypothetical protein
VLFVCLIAAPCLAQEARLAPQGDDMALDNKTGLIWQLDKSRKMFTTADDAARYAEQLLLGGNHDWRLPTLAERWDVLQAFMYKTNGDITFPKSDSKYWTAETDKGTQPIKLDISCMCRGDQEVEYKDKGYVRAVRGPVSDHR